MSIFQVGNHEQIITFELSLSNCFVQKYLVKQDEVQNRRLKEIRKSCANKCYLSQLIETHIQIDRDSCQILDLAFFSPVGSRVLMELKDMGEVLCTQIWRFLIPFQSYNWRSYANNRSSYKSKVAALSQPQLVI